MEDLLAIIPTLSGLTERGEGGKGGGGFDPKNGNHSIGKRVQIIITSVKESDKSRARGQYIS